MRRAQVTIRLRPEALARVDELTARGREEAERQGFRASRALTLERIVEAGLDALAAEADRVARQTEALG